MWRSVLLACLFAGCFATEYYDYSRYQAGRGVPDRVEVVSSTLRVLPRKQRVKRTPSWRKPRDYEFVTRDSGRSPRRLPYTDEGPSNNFPRNDYFERRNDFPNRRIIYYATLPDVVRRPGEWTPPRPIYPGYPPIRENEIVTRVHSGLIDVSNNNNYIPNNKYVPNRELPRFTIIDAEPPYARPPPRYNDRYDYRGYDYNRYDMRNQIEPYHGYYEPPYRHENLPAQPVTIVRRPVEVRPLDSRPLDSRPLDIRPLDGRPLDLVQIHPLSTQAPPLSSSTTASTTTTTSQDVSNFERSIKS